MQKNLVDGRKKTDSDVEGKASVEPSVAKGRNFFFGVAELTCADITAYNNCSTTVKTHDANVKGCSVIQLLSKNRASNNKCRSTLSGVFVLNSLA